MNKIVITLMALTATVAGVALAADAKAGSAVYDKSCKGCHGADGSGNPAIAKMFGVTQPVMSSAEFQAKPDAEIKKAVTDGAGKMPAQKNVTGADLDNLVAFLRTFKK